MVDALAVAVDLNNEREGEPHSSLSTNARTDLKTALIGTIGAVSLRLLSATIRWQCVGVEKDGLWWPAREPCILAFWHGRQLLMPWIYRSAPRKQQLRPIYALISQHRDGRAISFANDLLGIRSIAGSSTRGGREALFAIINSLKNGNHIAITPDGPKGPLYKLKPGLIRIAQRTGALIRPAAIGAERKWTFKSWDRMILPKPFSRCVMMMGDPIYIPPELSQDEVTHYTQLVEDALNDITSKSDSYYSTVSIPAS